MMPSTAEEPDNHAKVILAAVQSKCTALGRRRRDGDASPRHMQHGAVHGVEGEVYRQACVDRQQRAPAASADLDRDGKCAPHINLPPTSRAGQPAPDGHKAMTVTPTG
jgi:hypothetical protein